MSKSGLRHLHEARRIEQITSHRNKLKEVFDEVKEYNVDGHQLHPENIQLRLTEVKPGSLEERIYFWWNLVWWSIPYERPIGRQIRFLLWDDGHDAPFGLLGLQSPPLKMKARDRYLGLKPRTLDYWINQSMSAHRIGALPPYNLLLGAKMVALTAACKEVREAYERKYDSLRTVLKNRRIPAKLLFVTTTSAYGRSSVYDRLTYDGQDVCTFLGFTKGAGTFHVTDAIYKNILMFLRAKGVPTTRRGLRGTSRKLRLVDRGFRNLHVGFLHHGVQRGVYLFPHARNLNNVIALNKRPLWRNWAFNDVFQFWQSRWGVPRSERGQDWQSFASRKFFNKASRLFT